MYVEITSLKIITKERVLDILTPGNSKEICILTISTLKIRSQSLYFAKIQGKIGKKSPKLLKMGIFSCCFCIWLGYLLFLIFDCIFICWRSNFLHNVCIRIIIFFPLAVFLCNCTVFGKRKKKDVILYLYLYSKKDEFF